MAYGVDTADGRDDLVGLERQKWTDGICGKSRWGSLAGLAGSSEFAGTDPETEERANLIARYFIEQGYNTNYASSWFLVRTAPRVRYEEQAAINAILTNGQAAQQGLKGRRGTLGGLVRSIFGTLPNRVLKKLLCLGTQHLEIWTRVSL